MNNQDHMGPEEVDSHFSDPDHAPSESRPITTLQLWLGMAMLVAQKSVAPDKKVGAVAVENGNVVGWGFNHNRDIDFPETVDENGKTKPTVIHAEEDMIQRAADNGKSIRNCVVFLTHSPCLHCAARLERAGVKKIYFLEEFKNGQSHEYLNRHNIELVQVLGVSHKIDHQIQQEEDYEEQLHSMMESLGHGVSPEEDNNEA